MMPAELLHEMTFAGLRLEAGKPAPVGDHVEGFTDCQGRGDIRGFLVGGLAFVPMDVGLGDISDAVGTNRDIVIRRKAAGHEEEAVAVNDRRDILFGRALDVPDRRAGVRVVTGDAFAPR